MWLPGMEPDAITDGHDGSGDAWFTPPDVLDAVSLVLGPWGDPCSDPRSPAASVAAWSRDYRRDGDQLACGWPAGAVYVNPPYSNASEWIERCAAEARKGRPLMMLVPFRAEGIAWHRHVWPSAAVVLPRGRIKFVALDGQTYGAAQVGTAFVCWGCDAYALADALPFPAIVLQTQAAALPW